MKHIILTVTVAAGILAGTANGGYLTGDPRVCSYNKPGLCVHWASTYTLRQAVAKKEGLPRWDGWVYCQSTAGNMLRQQCFYKQGDVGGKANIWFRATSSGWKRIVTFT